MASEIHVIVERLNDAPFNLQLTLAAFDEKSPFELLEVVNLVMGHLSDEHKIDLRDETPERTINRMMSFLSQLNFKPPTSMAAFQQALLQGNPAAIYPMLAWMLVRLPELKKRAYLARFLTPIEMPEHMFGDEEIAQLHGHLRELQDEFKEAHKALGKLGSAIISPAEIKRAVVQMEDDREQLNAKVEALQNRLKTIDSYKEMLDAVSTLRKEQDEGGRLQQRVAEQAAQLQHAQQTARALQAAVRDAQATDMRGGGAALLAALGEEVEAQKALFDKGLPAQIDEQRDRLAELEGALADGPVSQDALREARANLAGLQAKARQLELAKGAAAGGGGAGAESDGLAMFRQQAAIIARKHEAVKARLAASSAERDGLERELMAKMAALEEVAPQGRSAALSTKADDFKKYAANLRGKTAQYKRCKAALAELRAEFALLHRTEQLLQAQARSVGAKLTAIETSKGIGGYTALQTSLEKASEAKAAADEAKGQTLEEISAVVDEINEEIKSRKNKLAPQIKELRSLRAQYQQLEAEYVEKKGVYENTAVGLDSELSKLQEEVSAYEDDIAKEESRYHYLNSLQNILAVSASRAQAEASGTTRVAAAYAARLREQEEQTKELRAQQRTVKESHDRNAGQIHLFKDLHRLLKCKAECQQRELDQRENNALLGAGGANVFTMPEAGNRYVDIDGHEHS